MDRDFPVELPGRRKQRLLVSAVIAWFAVGWSTVVIRWRQTGLYISDANNDICIRLRILNPDRQPLGGMVDLEFKPRNTDQAMIVKAAPASKEIDVRGLRRTPVGLYQLTVIPTDVFKPVSQFVNIPASSFNTLEIVIDKGPVGKPGPPADSYKVCGVVRDQFQRPMAGAVVKVSDKDIRNEQPLGRPATTDASGTYQVVYSRKDFAQTDLLAADVIVRVYGAGEKLLKESDVFYNAPQTLRADINLADRSYTGPSEFEQTVQTIAPFIGELPPSDLTEDQKTQDITFLANKTGFTRGRVEAYAMAFRIEKNTGLQASVFFGLIQQGSSTTPLTQPTVSSSATSFENKVTLTFAGIMRQDIDSLMSAIQTAIGANIIPLSLSGELDSIKKQLIDAQQKYAEANSAPKSPPSLTLKLGIAGLQGDQVTAFKSLFTQSGGTPQDFWSTLAKDPAFQAQKVSLLQSVFTLSQLTGEQLVLTDQLIKAQNIQSPADLPKLAANTSQDWLTILNEQKIQPPAGIPGATAGPAFCILGPISIRVKTHSRALTPVWAP
jgi:hypothetical protein